MEHVRARVIITGRVQGVNFRADTRTQARAQGVRGWVRNLDDGRVEALFEGPPAAVRHVVSWCSSGPPHAAVVHVAVAWEQPTGTEQEFTIAW